MIIFSEATGIREVFGTYLLVHDYPLEHVISTIEGTAFAGLLAEGVPVLRVAEVVYAGIETVEGARLVLLERTPVEWVLAFEAGQSS